MTAGVDLMDAVKYKFDATSARVGLPQRLTASPYAKETTDVRRTTKARLPLFSATTSQLKRLR
jgi:hypothetical protein